MEANPAVYYRVWGADNIAYGPVELPALVQWVKSGRVDRTTWLFNDATAAWARAADLSELKMFFKPKPPPGGSSVESTQGLQPGSLRRIKILADMDDRQLASFLSYMEMVKYLPNGVVCHKEEQGDAMFLVLQGELRARLLVDGREHTLATLGVGECFGEMAVLDESPRSADVISNTESVLLKISGGSLKKLFQEAPALAAPFLLALGRTLTGRIRKLDKVLANSIQFARSAHEA